MSRKLAKRPSLPQVMSNPEKYITPTKLYGIHRAYCRSDSLSYDPKLRGRIRVFCPRIHPEDTPDENLPWAEPCFSDGGGDNYGDFHVPSYDDTVWIMFEGGVREQPVWMGTWWGMPNNKSEIVSEAVNETQTQIQKGIQRYPNRRVWKSRYGHTIQMGDDEEELELVVSSKNGNKLVLRDSPSHIENGEVVRSMGVRLEDQNGNYLHLDPDAGLFSVYFIGDKVETIVGDYTLQIKKAKDGTGGNKLELIEGANINKNRIK